MSVTWLVVSTRLNTFPKKIYYWSGESWVTQIWDAAHFETKQDAAIFLTQRCDLSKKSDWLFDLMPVDSGMDF